MARGKISPQQHGARPERAHRHEAVSSRHVGFEWRMHDRGVEHDAQRHERGRGIAEYQIAVCRNDTPCRIRDLGARGSA